MTSCNYLAIDAGGTFFKYALLNENAEFLTEIKKISVEEDGDAECILASYKRIFDEFDEISCVCISTPGPFDYKNGKSLMKHKFKAIYNIPLRDELQRLSGAKVLFLSDSNAFLLGEACGKYQNVIGITIGTGFGFAAMKNGELCVDENGGPCEKPYNTPYNNMIAEDYISGRGISKRYEIATGKLVNAKEIADRAKRGEMEAMKVYEEMGVAIGRILKPYIQKYISDTVIIGGQVARNFELFKNSIDLDVHIIAAENIEGAALVGATYYGRGKLNESFNYNSRQM